MRMKLYPQIKFERSRDPLYMLSPLTIESRQVAPKSTIDYTPSCCTQ